MRLLFVVPVLALALGACGKNAGDDDALAGPQMTANAIHANDVTAIDAVTGEAANIAADVDIDDSLLTDINSSDSEPAPRPRSASRPGRTDEPAPAPASNTAAPAPQPKPVTPAQPQSQPQSNSAQ